MFETLLVERDGPVVILTANRPKVLNALNATMVGELERATRELAHDSSVRCLILTGAGDKAFIAGADISELAELTPSAAWQLARRGQRVCDQIEQMGKPVIAAIKGFALGGGCEIAMAATLRIAADTARLGQPEINLGLFPGYGGTQRLPRLIGKGRALELMLTGQRITADEAWRLGLVNRVLPAASVMDAARALARELAGKPPLAVRYLLEAVNAGLDRPLADAVQHEAALFGLVAATEDMHEGTRAFLEKRKPEFKGW